MKNLLRNLLLCVALVLVYTTVTSAAENTGLPTKSSDIQIEMKDGSLSLETHDAPLHEVMRGIGELAGFKTILAEDFIEPPLVNVLFKSIAVREAVERLVSNKNRIIFYAPAGDETGQRIISQVWLLGPGSAPDGDELSDDESIASGQEKLVKGHKLIRLTKMLQESQEVQVRTRAAISLGALQDERAVLALESALLDQHFSVRSQAINALGQIGSEQAIIVLGSILLNSSANITERVMAAQALSKQDSAVAQGYLHSGAYDKIEQVRLASSNPSSPLQVRAMNDQIGNAEAQ